MEKCESCNSIRIYVMISLQIDSPLMYTNFPHCNSAKMKNLTTDTESETGKQSSLLPDGILFPATDDTVGVVEKENQKKAVAGFLWARTIRRPLHPAFEKYLPFPLRKVYYDFSVVGYLVVFAGTFGAIIGLGILGAILFRS
jgi:hypothetical protein